MFVSRGRYSKRIIDNSLFVDRLKTYIATSIALNKLDKIMLTVKCKIKSGSANSFIRSERRDSSFVAGELKTSTLTKEWGEF